MKFSALSGLPSARKAFTLIELMVVVTIIAVLAALIVPSLQKAQTAAMGRACMAKIKVIPVSLRAYSASWEGWTSTISDYYLNLAGYKLATDPDPSAAGKTMSQNANWAAIKAQQGIGKEWVCPVDGNPPSTPHGVRSSYKVGGSFIGKNLMAHEGAANKILAGIEIGTRHPTTVNAQTIFDKHYSFADGHATLGATGLELPGVTIRYFNVSSSSSIEVAESELPLAEIETSISSGNLGFSFRSFFLKAVEKVGTIPDWKFDPTNSYDREVGNQNRGANGDGHYRNSKCPINLVVRVDGVLKFPTGGRWFFGASNDMYRRAGSIRSTKMFAISGEGKGNASIAGGDTPDQNYANFGEHNTGRNASHRNRAVRSQGVTINPDIGKPFHKFWVIFPFPTSYTHYDRYGPQGVEWSHPDPANGHNSDVGRQDRGELLPLKHCFTLP